MNITLPRHHRPSIPAKTSDAGYNGGIGNSPASMIKCVFTACGLTVASSRTDKADTESRQRLFRPYKVNTGVFFAPFQSVRMAFQTTESTIK